MKKQIELPSYFSIDAYQKMGNIDDLSDLQRIVKVLSALTGIDTDEIERWNLDSINEVYAGVNTNLLDIEPMLIPVFEFKGITWGMQPLSKMTVGEYLDLENELKTGDYISILPIIYRPIEKNRLNSFEWKLKYNFKYVVGEVENLFKYYTIEPYDYSKNEEYSSLLKDLPVSMVMGALNFFLFTGITSQSAILTSSTNLSPKEKKILEEKIVNLLINTRDGFPYSLN